MSSVLGVDVSSHAIDLVKLDETTNTAHWTRIPLHGRTLLDRIRAVPTSMPTWAYYDDVYLACIETPKTRFMPSAAALFPVYGATIACLPHALHLWDAHPTIWRHTLQLPGNATKQQVAARAIELGADPDWDQQDAYDAYAIALYARDTNRDAIEAALTG